MEDVLGVDAIISQMIDPGHIFLVNTEGLAFETAVEDPQVLETSAETSAETSGEDPQQFQNLGGLQNQLNSFILGQQSVETVRKTKREAKAFQTWLDGQREAEGLPMAKIEPKRLNILLGSYLLNKRKKNGDEYEPSSLAGTFSSIKRFLEQSSYPVPLMGTEDFKMAREVLASKKKDLKAKGKGNRPNKVSIFFFFFN